jgi:signal peptidase I
MDFERKYISDPINQSQFNAIRKYLTGTESIVGGKVALYAKANGIPINVIRNQRLALTEETPRARRGALTDEMVRELKNDAAIDSVVRKVAPKGKQGGNNFPQDASYPWNYDQMGPIYIPEKGKTVNLNLNVLPLFKKIIREYEGNTISVSGNQIKLNGKVADSYTFEQDYYWMMGDNRDHSEDSRAWGYVPENHIVGTPIFIWFSVDNFNQGVFNWRPRWDRVFTTVNGEGEPVSYFKYFLIALVAYFVGSWLWRRRKDRSSN